VFSPGWYLGDGCRILVIAAIIVCVAGVAATSLTLTSLKTLEWIIGQLSDVYIAKIGLLGQGLMSICFKDIFEIYGMDQPVAVVQAEAVVQEAEAEVVDQDLIPEVE